MRTPVLLLAHGSPIYSVKPSRFSEAWAKVGTSIQKPKAILMISAHWVTNGTHVTDMDNPPTIHDFGGIDQRLFDIQYPAPGCHELASRVNELCAPIPIYLDKDNWGFDHGAWGVLKHLYPNADIPVVQMSLNQRFSFIEHYMFAKQLAPLRNENILIIASGNIAHNLYVMDRNGIEPYPWALEFNEYFKKNLLSKNHDLLIDLSSITEAARMAIPTPEHYWPALYACALQEDDETVEIIVDGIDMRSVSMLSFKIS